MSKRKHISFKTRCASLIIQCGLVPYDDAKLMTDDQILSVTQVDHNILHEIGHPDRDCAWNLTHVLIKAHREKTKIDAKIIAKSRRIRKRLLYRVIDDTSPVPDRAWGNTVRKRKIRSGGFDKTRKRKLDGTVVKRNG